jgi:DHA2 family multidrug resistance protein
LLAAAIPGFLGGVARYRPIETGAALAWVAFPQFALVWIAAILTVFIQPRIVMAAGFATIAIACWMSARLDSGWAGTSFQLAELMLATGIAVARKKICGNAENTVSEAAVCLAGADTLVHQAHYACKAHQRRVFLSSLKRAVPGRVPALLIEGL